MYLWNKLYLQSSNFNVAKESGVRCTEKRDALIKINMPARFSEKTRRAIFFARYEASNYGSPNIESEHLLLGLLRETVLLQKLLKTGRESIEVLRKEIEAQMIRRSPILSSVPVPLSQQCKLILNYAAEEAQRLGHGHVEPEHLLLGVLCEDQCLGARMLQSHKVTVSRVREEIMRGGRGAETRPGETVRPREWCCADFEARCYQSRKKENGLGIIMLITSKTGTHFLLEYRRPDRTPSEPIAADGIKLKFCPWCGRNLAEWYGTGLPPFQPPISP